MARWNMYEWTLPHGFSTGTRADRSREETLYVLEGTCELTIGADLILARPGTYQRIPAGMSHAIANMSGRDVVLLMTASPSIPANDMEALLA